MFDLDLLDDFERRSVIVRWHKTVCIVVIIVTTTVCLAVLIIGIIVAASLA